MSPKVSEAYLEQRRQQILDAAVACFSQHGFHEATLADICERAGLSRGAVYHYFKSKEDIIDGIRERSTGDYEPLWEKLTGEGDSRQRLAEFERFAFENMAVPGAEQENRLGILLWAEALLNPRILQGQREVMAPLRERITAIVVEAQRRGEIDPDLDAAHVGHVLVGAVLGFQIQRAWDPELDPHAAADVIESLLLRSLAPPAASNEPPSED